jgi:hypothetical protein
MLEFAIEYGFGYGKPTPGHRWKATFYDRATQIRASSSGDSAWEAIAWALVNWRERICGVLNIARNTIDTPASSLAALQLMSPSEPAKIREPAVASVPSIASTDAATSHAGDGGTFSLAPSIPKSAAARRARTKKTARTKP